MERQVTSDSISLAANETQRRELIEQAEALMPDNKGHWDDWVLARVTERVTRSTTHAVAFEDGDIVLAEPTGTFCSAYRLAFSFRSKRNTSIPTRRIILL